MAPLSRTIRAARDLGLGPLLLYTRYTAALQSGWLRLRTPMARWGDRPLAAWKKPNIPEQPAQYVNYRETEGPRFFFEVNSGFDKALRSAVSDHAEVALQVAEDILQGSFRLFGGDPVTLGFPPNWGTFAPIAGGENTPRIPLHSHWSAYNLDAFPADVKLLWEVARFGWVYPLARAYRMTGDERYAEGLWELIASWTEANQPNAGPHWMSAQEVGLRLMALVFTLYSFWPQLREKPARAVRLVEMIAVHAHRIPPTLTYARAQGNNHLLIEAVALYTAGLLFPELQPATHWRKLGRHWLLQALDRQIFSDGGYVQQSTNYQRLALHAGLWAARLADANRDPLPQQALNALRRLSVCLSALIDPESGKVPNFGPNDGAHILPLSTCAWEDFRPEVQMASVALDSCKVYPPGPWDETCLWLGLEFEGLPYANGTETSRSEPIDLERESKPRAGAQVNMSRHREDFPHAGLFIIRGERSWGMLRCARFDSRPGHSDQLHFDLWWHGRNVACDPGTYLYNGRPPWENSLTGAGVHNTLVVDGKEPMQRASRFLYQDWAQGSVLGRWRLGTGSLEVLAAEHDGYRHLGIVHRRTIVRAGDHLWLVVDDVGGTGFHSAHLGWLVPDGPWAVEDRALRLGVGKGRIAVRVAGSVGPIAAYRAGVLASGMPVGAEGQLWGWRSEHYAYLKPAIRIVAKAEGALPLRLETWWILGDADPKELSIGWRDPGQGVATAWLEYRGDRLETNDAYLTDPSSIRHIE